MKRPRPHIPIVIRLEVAVRQYRESGGNVANFFVRMRAAHGNLGKRERLTYLLKEMFPETVPELDHDPALILRPFDPATGNYTPRANDPDWLVWRRPDAHQEKTSGRRPGARSTITTKGSDIGLKTKFARLEKRRVDTSDIPETRDEWFRKAKVKIPSRGFQKRGKQSQ